MQMPQKSQHTKPLANAINAVIRWSAGAAIALATANALADNPLVSHVYTADPSGRVFNDRVYVITTHDPDGSTSYAELQDYFLWSSDDMVNWQDHGIIFGTQTHTTWAFGAYAPDMMERNGKFYLVFPNVTSGIGILEADHPEGPYVDIKGSAVITAQNTQNARVEWLFDPGIMVDDFVHDRPINVIGSKTQSNLSGLFPEHDPIGFYVGNIVQH